ncbi:hypothetical protein [Gluconobacter sp. P1C6_b]|uniref:hypothetical protein n=1 Tax=Gluconobacter sp. P1C6_b TaxID=2762619 RepID=UPI001C05CDC7|nr:hypothetical protein [Gluconobacter sp. P1C6_b]
MSYSPCEPFPAAGGVTVAGFAGAGVTGVGFASVGSAGVGFVGAGVVGAGVLSGAGVTDGFAGTVLSGGAEAAGDV